MLATVLRNSVFAILLLILYGCSESNIHVEITNPADRAKYIELLNKNGLEYVIDKKGVISVKAGSYEELQQKMKGYEEWKNAQLKKEGVVIPTQ